MDYIAPAFNKDEFNCPNCKVFAHQIWGHFEYRSSSMNGVCLSEIDKSIKSIVKGSVLEPNGKGLGDISMAFCMKCKEHSVWVDGKLVYPTMSIAPLPVKNMPEEVLKDFNEARDVFEKSPRASAALLRLAIQKLCKILGGEGKNIDDDIGFLVREKGLPEKIQKALDIVRVVGNNAVHPGTINIDDNPEIAMSLFKLVNLIVDTMINQPLEIDELYDILPEGAKKSIEKRDKKH